MPEVVDLRTSHPWEKVWRVYWPLALSWIFMAMEGQVSMWLIGQMSDAKVLAAGFLALFAVSIFIESPVIDLLTTGTTLGTDTQKLSALLKFTKSLMLLVTAVHGLVAFTPLYDLIVRGVLDAPAEVAAAAKPGFMAMTVWAAGVGWRRSLQGTMIRSGQTRAISWGTLIRIVVLAAVGWPLSVYSSLPGLGGIGIALTCAVWAETFYIHAVSRRVVAGLAEPDASAEPLTSAKIFQFHWPMTASTMLVLTTPIFVTRALNASSDGVVAMAAWQTAFSLSWIFRTVIFAIPEAVISVFTESARRALAAFTWTVGGALTCLMAAYHLSGLDGFTFSRLYGTSPDILPVARTGFAIVAVLPVLGSGMSYYRAVLTARHITWPRVVAIIAGLGGLVGSLALGVAARWPGVVTAATAIDIGIACELLALVVCWMLVSRPKPGSSQEASPLPAEV